MIDELPDLEWAVNEVLMADGHRAYSSIPAKNPTFPLFVTFRLGGISNMRYRLDAARIQIEAWGDERTPKGDVWDLVNAGRKALLEAEGTRVELGDDAAAFIAAVEDESLPVWLPDPRTSRPRYIYTARVTAHVAEPAASS